MIRKLYIITNLIILLAFFCVSVCAQEVADMEITITIGDVQRTGLYTGTTKNGLPEGFGRFDAVNSEGEAWYYEGGFKNGLFDGEGKAAWEGGSLQKGIFRNGELYNGKIWNNDGELIKEMADGKVYIESQSYIKLVLLIIVGVIALIVTITATFRTIRMAKNHGITPGLLDSHELVWKESANVLKRTTAIRMFQEGALRLYDKNIDFVGKKKAFSYDFSDILKVYHGGGNGIEIIFKNRDKITIGIRPKSTTLEWVEAINNQISIYRQSSQERSVSDDVIDVIAAYMSISGGSLFLYKDRIEFASKNKTVIIPFPQICSVQRALFNTLEIKTYTGEEYTFSLSPSSETNKWVGLIHNQINIHKNSFYKDNV